MLLFIIYLEKTKSYMWSARKVLNGIVTFGGELRTILKFIPFTQLAAVLMDFISLGVVVVVRLSPVTCHSF